MRVHQCAPPRTSPCSIALLVRMQMELATPPPAARAPVAWYSWWLMPLALGGGTVAATFMSSERITAAVAGAAATAAGSVCVRLLIRSQRQLRRVEGDFRTS